MELFLFCFAGGGEWVAGWKRGDGFCYFGTQVLVISQRGHGHRLDRMHLDLYTLCVAAGGGGCLTYYFYF